MFTGIVGAGGGFVIVPALAVYVRLPMRVAVGTSLTIIAAKSLIGFLGDVRELSNSGETYLRVSGCGIATTLSLVML